MYELLIVDDEAEIRRGLTNYFPWEQLGFVVVGQAENGAEALAFSQAHNVDVILCDIKMPVMTGLELAKVLSESNHFTGKLVFLSGHREFEFAREALAYGVRDYVLKPTHYDQLHEVFSKLKDELDSERHDATKTPELFSYYREVMAKVRTYVGQNIKSCSLEEAAQLVHMHPSYLSKLFKEETGENFSDYVTRIKMDRAAELLQDVSLRTYQISEMVGYTNPKNFSRAFKRYFGKTPREYRA